MNISHFQRFPFISAIGLAAACSASVHAQDTVEYTFEFVAHWSEPTHPTSFPSNPHFSPIIGTNHTADYSMWATNAIATNGFERMAETGSTTVLASEILTAIDSETAQQVFSLGSISNSPDSLSRTITVHRDFPLISLVTMIAPSPDWFVGVHDVNLRPGGVWAQDLILDLDAYDSGTDSGINYGSPNADVTPHEPISNISDIFPFTGTIPMGTFRFSLISDAGCSQADFAEPYGELNFFDVSAYLEAFLSQDSVADLNADGSIDFFDVSTFLNLFASSCP